MAGMLDQLKKMQPQKTESQEIDSQKLQNCESQKKCEHAQQWLPRGSEIWRCEICDPPKKEIFVSRRRGLRSDAKKLQIVLVVTGGRDVSLTDSGKSELDRLADQFEILELVHGDCRGIDRDCKNWAVDRGIKPHDMPADWNRLGNSAGPIRNRQMVDYAKQTGIGALAAFPGNQGTANCRALAAEAGLRIFDIANQATYIVTTIPAPQIIAHGYPVCPHCLSTWTVESYGLDGATRCWSCRRLLTESELLLPLVEHTQRKLLPWSEAITSEV